VINDFFLFFSRKTVIFAQIFYHEEKLFLHGWLFNFYHIYYQIFIK